MQPCSYMAMKFFYPRIFTDFLPKRIEQVPNTIRKASSILTSKGFEDKVTKYFLLYFVFIACFFAYAKFVLYKEYENLRWMRNQELIALVYWEEVIRKHPNFPDAYYQAGVHSLRLNSGEKALMYLDKAILLDPAFEDALKLKSSLQ